MQERGLTTDYIYWIWRKPDKYEAGSEKTSYKYYRQLRDKCLVVVAKKNEKQEWILLSCWWKFDKESSQSPLKATTSFWQSFWQMIKG